MCIFHEALSEPAAFGLAPVIVALSSLENGSTLFAQIAATIKENPGLAVGNGAQHLRIVAHNPYRYLGVLTRHAPDHGNGSAAATALASELLQASAEQCYFVTASSSDSARAVLASSTIEEALRHVAIAGHAERPAFLQWFRDNPSASDDKVPAAIRILEGVANEVLRPLPVLPMLVDVSEQRREPDRRGDDRPACCQQP
jgi:hypothetical protein